MPFQLCSKSLFLTYPQCDFPLEDFVEVINLFFGDNIEKGVACQENHKDGNQHLHLALVLKNPYRTRKVDCFDSLVCPPKHPNISGKFKGGIKKAFQYVMKEGNYLPLPSEFNLPEFMEAANGKKSTKALLVATEIQKGKTLDEIDDLYPDYVLQNAVKIQAYMTYYKLKKTRMAFALAQLTKVRVSPAEGYFSPWNRAIASWLTLNLRQTRVHRQTQLWIQGGHGIGKTSLMKWLRKTFKLSVYNWPKDEKWWDGYQDGTFDLIMIDEFKAQKTITEMNAILSGDDVMLSRRNAAPYEKFDILPVIVLSNYTPDQCYTNSDAQALAPLNDRLQVVMCDGPIRIVSPPYDQLVDWDEVFRDTGSPFIPLTPSHQAQTVFSLSDGDDPIDRYDGPVEFLDGNPRIREQEDKVKAFLAAQSNTEEEFTDLNDPWGRYRTFMKTAVDRSKVLEELKVEKNKKANLIAEYFK